MRDKASSRSIILAWVVFSTTIFLVVIGLVIFNLTKGIDVGPRWGPRYFPVGFALGFGIMALLILARQPKNRIGWLYSWIGLAGSLLWFLENYADLSLLAGYDTLPYEIFAAWVASWIWIPAAVPALTILPLIFPDGRLLSPRWRPLAWLNFCVILLFIFVGAFTIGPLNNFSYLNNPYGIFNISNPGQPSFDSPIFSLVELLLLAVILVSIASFFLRLQRSSGVERQQLKWFAYAGVGLFIGALGGFFGPILGGLYFVIGPILLIAALMFIPVLTGMAILRYRLWEIDLLIRKTLQYSLVTGLLIVIYLVTILLLQRLVTWVTGQSSNLVIVISTLLIAALFSPVRLWVQKFIDRRFYRNKYNADTILSEFASIARNEMDIDRLSRTILELTDTTMHPAKLSLWMKKLPERREI
jgi:hypothetical protein